MQPRMKYSEWKANMYNDGDKETRHDDDEY
jgi:hypothetical protein